MLIYVIFGGMLATTWVQIIKAVLLMTATIVLSLFVLGKIGWNPIDIFDRAEAQSDDRRRVPGAGPAVHRTRSTRSRSGSGCCWGPRGCRTS